MKEETYTTDVGVWSVNNDIRVGSLVLSSEEAKRSGMSMDRFAEICASLHAFMREIKEQASKIVGRGEDYIVQPLGNMMYMLAFLDHDNVTMVLVDERNKEIKQAITIAEYRKIMDRATNIMMKTQNIVSRLNRQRINFRQVGDIRADQMAGSVKEAIKPFINPVRAGPQDAGKDHEQDTVYRMKNKEEIMGDER